MNHFRETITVFGDRLRVVFVDKNLNPDDWVILYENLSKPKERNKACHLSDWMEWDQAARAKGA